MSIFSRANKSHHNFVEQAPAQGVEEGLESLDELEKQENLHNLTDLARVNHAAHVVESELWQDALQGRSQDRNIGTAASYLARMNASRHRYNHTIEAARTSLRERLLGSLSKAEINPENLGTYIDAMEACVVDLDPLSDESFFNVLHDKHQQVKNLEAAEAQISRYQQLLKKPEVLATFGSRFNSPHDSLFVDTLAGLGIDDAESVYEAHIRESAEKSNKTRDLFETLTQLEKERPGAAALLHDFYGIRGFGRYPADLLVRQYDRHGDTDKPYGILCAAISDHNGALAELPQGFQPGGYLWAKYNLRVLEACSPIELGRRLLALDKLYGNKQKINFAFVEAHGSADAFWLRSQSESPRNLAGLTMEAKLKSGGGHSRASELFINNPVIVLDSCSTGQEGGIAQKISADMKATVIAPEEPGYNAVTVYATGVDGRLKIEPRYKQQNGRFSIHHPSIHASLFMSGKKIEGDEYRNYFAELEGPVKVEEAA